VGRAREFVPLFAEWPQLDGRATYVPEAKWSGRRRAVRSFWGPLPIGSYRAGRMRASLGPAATRTYCRTVLLVLPDDYVVAVLTACRAGGPARVLGDFVAMPIPDGGVGLSILRKPPIFIAWFPRGADRTVPQWTVPAARRCGLAGHASTSRPANSPVAIISSVVPVQE